MTAEFINNAEIHRKFSEIARKMCLDTKKGIEAENVKQILKFGDEIGEEGKSLVMKIAEKNIGPKVVPDNLNEIARIVLHTINPPVEPITTRIKTKPLGFLPFGGTEIIHTDYVFDNDSHPQKDGDSVTIERKTFWDRLFKRR